MKFSCLPVLLLLFLTSNSIFAQISFDKDSLKNDAVDRTKYDFTMNSYLTNNATNPDDTIFEWKVISFDQPNEWELTICTYDVCIAAPDLNDPYNFSLKVGEKEQFKIGWSLFETGGIGSVTVMVNSKKYPEAKDTLTMQIATLASLKSFNKTAFSVYPNPIQDEMRIHFSDKSSQNIVLYDILGNKVLSEIIFSGERINTSNLKKGVYILRIVGSSDFSKVIHKN